MPEKYLVDSIKFGARIGDIVTVINKGSGYTNGWHNRWVDEMDQYIGRSGILVDIRKEGHYIDFGDIARFGFPWFSLSFVR